MSVPVPLKRRNTIVLSITVGLGLFLLFSFLNFFNSLLGAILLYVLFRPFYVFMAEKKFFNKSLAASIVIACSFFAIVVPFFSLSILILNKVDEFRANPSVVKGLLLRIDQFASEKLQQPHLFDKLLIRLQDSAVSIFSSIVNSAFNIFILLGIMYVLLYFMLVEYQAFEKTLLKYMPFRQRNSLRFAKQLKYITYSNVIGQGVVSVVQGTLVIIGFYIFHLSDPVFWGVISMFLSFLPIVGAPTTMIVAGIIQMSNKETLSGIGAIAWGLFLIGTIDNIIRFILAKKIGDIHPLVTILGVIFGLQVFGILGLVFGPLLLSYFILLVNIYESSQTVLTRFVRIRNNLNDLKT